MRNLAIYLMFFISGATGLVYEVIWMRELRLVLGSSVEAASLVLATFLGGIAVGCFLGARLSRSGNPLGRYAIAELVVAVAALATPLWMVTYQAVYPSLYAWCEGIPSALFVVRALLSVVALVPPTIAMGTTLPLISRVVVTGVDRFARDTGLLYALNTFGAMAGAFLAGFLLPVSLGIRGSIYLAAAMNAIVGVTAWMLSRQPSEEAADASSEKPADIATSNTHSGRLSLPLLLLAGLSGFGSLALEVVYFRMLSYHSEGSVYSFSLMLVFVLAFLALAAVWVARNLDQQNVWKFLAWTQTAAVAVLLITPLVFRGLPFYAGYGADDTFTERMIRYAITSAVILGPSMLLIGVVLPCTWKLAAADRVQSGRVVGLLTGVNTLAAVTGSMVTGFVLLPRLGLGLTSLAVTGVYGITAVLAQHYGHRGLRRWLGSTACLAMMVGWFLLGGWNVQLVRLEPGQKLVSFHDGADATVAVVERSDGHRVLKVNHEYTLGSSAGADREVRQGRLPLMLHPNPRRIAFVGVATGMTVCSALDFPVERVVAVELLPGVADALPLFTKWNGNITQVDSVEVLVEDGRNYLAGTNEPFDVIISDLFVPWHAGTGDLYSVEHYEAARKRLAPGGIFAQCLPGYQLSVEELRVITASMTKVFPNTVLWRNDYDIEYPILCLTGYRDELRLDKDAVRKHAELFRKTKLTPPKFLSNEDGLPLLFVCGPTELAKWCEGAPLNTDDYPFIEFSTPKSLFQHRQMELQPIHDFLAGVRSHAWPFDQQPSEKPVQELFRIADLLIAAQKAYSESNFEREFQTVRELAQLAGNSPSVIGYVMFVAERYQSRKMGDRSTKLLEILAGFDDAPPPVLLSLAQDCQAAGNEAKAIEYFDRAVQRSPEAYLPRKSLVDLLVRKNEFDRAEPHLHKLIELKPNNSFLRIDLARNLHRQKKVAEARVVIRDFLQSSD
ncbi:MAG: fused MFS/spermidine synthase, partial [Pirellulales bacterium]|nr:fused MFS/spermidine synthase [Pirellulales bacterium]